MIDSTEARKGVLIDLEGTLYQVLDYSHIKMGRGSAQVRLRLRDIRGGHTVERTFQAGDRFKRAYLDRHNVQYLYNDGDMFYFMDTGTFEQSVLTREQVGDAVSYLKENMTLDLQMHEGRPVSLELPLSMELQVVDTGPGIRGDTAQGGTKPAVLETGITVQVPLFVNNGDVVRVDTRTGQYLERV